MTAREVALEVLLKVDKDKSYSNIQLNKELEKANLSRVDVSFATEIIYGTIQRLNTIDWILAQFIKPNTKLEPWVKSLLRLSIYQLFYLDRVPNHAVVNEAVNIANARGHRGISGLVNGILRNILRNKDSLTVPKNLSVTERLALEFSHPEWLVDRFIKDYGIENTKEICRVNNLAPFHSLRVNSLKVSRDDMINKLKTELGADVEVEPSLISYEGIRVKGAGNLALSHWYKAGYITVQDESSMLVADALDVQPGMVVLDALAAPGGKTTHIAERMQNKGTIIASDIHSHKTKLIEEQQERLGLNIIETIQSDAREINKLYGQIFDRILLDVPCSGFGVIRRKPDLKWAKSEKDIESLTRIQEQILEAASSLLKPGGIMVYSTCTLAKEENEEMIKRFIDGHPNFKLDTTLAKYLPNVVSEKVDASTGMVQILPHYFNTDGFFISRLQRVD